MLRKRLISAAVIIPTTLLLIWLDYRCGTPEWFGKPGLVLLASLMVVVPLAVRELLHFNEAANPPIENVKAWAAYAGPLLIIGFSFVPLLLESEPANCSIGRLGWPMFGVAAAVGLAFVAQMIGYRNGRRTTPAIAFTLLIAGYLGVLLAFWASIRLHGDNAWGLVALFSLFLPVKLSDATAFGAGKLFGKHKLAPNLSPGKTIEGLLGGLLGGVVGAAIVFFLIGPAITDSTATCSWIAVVVFGVAVTLVGVLGDLAESLLKRDSDVKNSSQWLPGLGGVLDIIDSVLVASPVVLVMWKTGCFGP